MSELERLRAEYAALPQWAKDLIDGLASCAGFGGMDAGDFGMSPSAKDNYQGFRVLLNKDVSQKWWDGFFAARDLAAAMTAPYPSPPAPIREKREFNVVEMMDDEQAFDQPCAFGNRCGGHAVYCHNEAWPDSPRKCRRTWYTGGETRDEDCPGFVANPDYVSKP